MKRLTRNIAVGCLAMCLVATAFAGDRVRIKLQDGSRWRGELSDYVTVTMVENGIERTFTGSLVKVKDIYIVVEGAVGSQTMEKLIPVANIVSIAEAEGGAAATEAGESADDSSDVASASNNSSAPAANANHDGPGLFVLPLVGTVGETFRHEEIEAIGQEADKYGEGQIIVLIIDSGGGLVTETEEIHEAMMELKKKHRVVAWIRKAISAACATAIHCDEIYFMTEGTAGSMTAFSGNTSLKGEARLAWEKKAMEWMAIGGRFPHIGRVMIHAPYSLSYDKDPETGEVTWHEDLSGEFILSKPGQNLTFHSSEAVHSGWSQGIADTEEELARQMQLNEWKETNDYGRKLAEDWQETCERAKIEIPRLFRQLNYKNISQEEEVRIGTQIKIMKELVAWWRRCPNVCRLVGVPPKEVLERQIEQLRYTLAQRRRNDR